MSHFYTSVPVHLGEEAVQCTAAASPLPSLCRSRLPHDGTTDRVVTMSCVQPSSRPAPAHLINIVIFLLLSPSPAQPSPAQPSSPGDLDPGIICQMVILPSTEIRK